VPGGWIGGLTVVETSDGQTRFLNASQDQEDAVLANLLGTKPNRQSRSFCRHLGHRV
jgi:hypothetical protein